MPEIGPLCESRPGGHSLAARMAEGPLPLAAVLGYAGDVAKELGELHHSGAAHGEVAPVAIRLNERGALLLPSHGRARAANPREDVSAFGALLSEMLAGNGGTGGAIREATSRLAAGCLASGDVAPDLCRLAVQLRVLRVLARFREEPPVSASPQPAATAESKPSPSPPVEQILPSGNPDAALQPTNECPRCSGPVFRSRPCTLVERILFLLGIRPRRCHACYYRYFRVFGARISRRD